MSQLPAVNGKQLLKVLEGEGWYVKRIRGSVTLTCVTPSSGAIPFYWKVVGNKLEGGKAKTLNNVKLAKGVLKVNGVDAKNNAYEVQCTVVTTEGGKNLKIRGGTSGTLEISLKFEGCTIPKPGAPCAVKGKEIVASGLAGALLAWS